MKEWFWYSRKQYKAMQKRRDMKLFVMRDNIVTPYTEATTSPTPDGKWDDYVLVGESPDWSRKFYR